MEHHGVKGMVEGGTAVGIRRLVRGARLRKLAHGHRVNSLFLSRPNFQHILALFTCAKCLQHILFRHVAISPVVLFVSFGRSLRILEVDSRACSLYGNHPV